MSAPSCARGPSTVASSDSISVISAETTVENVRAMSDSMLGT